MFFRLMILNSNLNLGSTICKTM